MVFVPDGLRLLALECEHLFEERPEGREMALRPCLLPGFLGASCDASELLNEPLRDLCRAVVVVAQFADVSRLDRVRVADEFRLLALGEERADLRIRRLFVCETGEERKLLASVHGAGL